MRAALLIGIPMLVLSGVMTFVFWVAADMPEHVRRPQRAPLPQRTPRTQPAQAPEVSKATPKPLPANPPPEAAAMQPVSPLTTQRVAKAADAIDDWVNVNRSRLKRNREVQLRLAKQALAAGRPAQALAACDRVLASHPDDVAALSAKAEALVALQRLAEAAAIYARVIELDPKQPHLRYNEAVVLSRLKRFGEAIRAYEAVLAQRPNHAKAMHNLAVIYQHEGKLSDAATLWKRITDTNPTIAGAWFNRGLVSLLLGDHQAAAEALTRANELEPGRPDTRVNLGLAYQSLGENNKAIEAYRQALEADRKNLAAVNGIAEVYVGFYETALDMQEQLEYGLHWCRYSLSIKPNQPRVAALYERILKVRPNEIAAMNGLAHMLAATPPDHPQYPTHHRRAVELYRRSLDANPDQPEVEALLERLTAPTR